MTVRAAGSCLVLGVCCFLVLSPAAVVRSADPSVEEITIYRDEFGIPNIYGKTEEGAAFGMGYAQAEDRLEELLKQYRRCVGTMAEAFGEEFVQHDYRQRLWQHQAIAEASYPKLSAKTRALFEAYQAGIRTYMKQHPKEVPTWAPKLEPWQVIALTRFIIWGWPEGDAAGDLRRAGIKPDPISARGSNQWVIAANRTADGYPLALVDPHLSWYGEFRFYEARLYGGELAVAGMAIPGLHLPSLGHSRYCSIAMTTGGPDAADVYEVETMTDKPRKYKYDDAVREMTVRQEVIKVKAGDKITERRFELEYTHHGPVVARRGNKAYAMKLPYFDQFRLPEQTYAMITARNLKEMKSALSLFQLMEQNIMVATVDGDIFYVRNARVPIRPNGFNWRLPVPGNISASEWLGVHAIGDLVHSQNPWQGYLQNCNISPEFMTKNSPMRPERYAQRPYVYNADSPLHQRAAMVQEMLHMNGRMTVPEAIDIALSPQVYNADLWQARLANALDKAGQGSDGRKIEADFAGEILRWNRRLDVDSTGAMAYWFWKQHLGEQVLLADRAGAIPPEVDSAQLLDALSKGKAKLEAQFGSAKVKYGDVHRVGRAGSTRTWPVAGGSTQGLATPRAIGFNPSKDGKTALGRGGQTAVQVIQLSKPPRSWTLLPLGESDRPDSKHFDDQAERLFSPGKMKPTYFLDKTELLKHVESKKVVQWQKDKQ